MPAVKRTNKKIKISAAEKQKKSILLTVAAFAVVGLVLLIRSFAATTVYGVNIIDILSANNPKWTVQNVKTADVQDGKKTQKVVQLKSDSVLRYEFSVNKGYYVACFNLKPTSANAVADIAVGVTDRPAIKGGRISVADGTAKLNTYKEACVKFYESGELRGFVVGLSTPEGTWEVNTFAIRVDEDYASYSPNNQLISLSSAFANNVVSAPITFTGASLGSDAGASVVSFPTGASVTFKTTDPQKPNTRYCFWAKPLTPDAVATISTGRDQRGGASEVKVGQQGTAVGKYTNLCSQTATHQNVSAADPLWQGFTATKGNWYISYMTIEVL